MNSKTISIAACVLAASLFAHEASAQTTRGSYTTYGAGCRGSGTIPGGKVVPTAYRTKWGESNNVFPFGVANQRYQQVHSAQDIGVVPVPTRGLAFRTKNGRALSARVIPCTILVGYTTRATSALSTTFASNWTGTASTVFNGNLNVPSKATNNNLNAFDTVIPFKSPFIYLPARGNFLWECQNRATARVSNIYDRVASQPSLIGRMWATGPTTATGTFRAGEGLVMQLQTSATTGATVNLTNTGVPIIRRSFSVGFNGAVANSAAILWLGAQRLNISLSPVLPGCTLYTSLDAILGGTSTQSGAGSLSFTLPNDTKLIGVRFRNQWMIVDQKANGLGVVLSNGGDAQIGG